jgi:hypothetical protein
MTVSTGSSSRCDICSSRNMYVVDCEDPECLWGHVPHEHHECADCGFDRIVEVEDDRPFGV